MVYLDSSALVKRFIDEDGSAFVDHIFRRHSPIFTSRLSYAEIHSCFARLKRERALSGKKHAAASKRFDKDFGGYRLVELTAEIFGIARVLLERHPLRALDAIQLASAARLRQVAGNALFFAGADRRLLDIAAREGFRSVDVESEPIPKDGVR